MYLLDTDTLTHLHAGNYNVIDRLKSVVNIEVVITIITKVEISCGRIDRILKAETGANLLKAQELLFRTKQLLNDLAIMPIDRSGSIEFDRFRAESKFRKIGLVHLISNCQSRSTIYNPQFINTLGVM